MKSTVVEKKSTGKAACQRRWRRRNKQRELTAFRNECEKRRAADVAGTSKQKLLSYTDFRNIVQKLYVTNVKDVSMESRGFEWDAVRMRYVGPGERAIRQQYLLPDNVSSSSLSSPELQVESNNISVFADYTSH